MALYVSAARRLRRTVAIAAATGLVALAVGWAVGRHQVPSIDARVADVEARAADLATNIERLDIEYEQAMGGTDTVDAGVVAPLDDLRAELQGLMDDAPWLTGPRRASLLDALAGLRSEALDAVEPSAFATTATAAADLVRDTFGVAA